MKVKQIVVLLSIVGMAAAQQPASRPVLGNFAFWSASKITSLQKQLTTKGQKATEQLGDSGSFWFFVERRAAGEYEPEAHNFVDDLITVKDGEATLVYGGKIEGGRDIGNGEIREGKIVGGTAQTIATGDVIFLAVGTPHHISVAPGKHVYILTLKANSGKTKSK